MRMPKVPILLDLLGESGMLVGPGDLGHLAHLDRCPLFDKPAFQQRQCNGPSMLNTGTERHLPNMQENPC